jgi:hypothetical protein
MVILWVSYGYPMVRKAQVKGYGPIRYRWDRDHGFYFGCKGTKNKWNMQIFDPHYVIKLKFLGILFA